MSGSGRGEGEWRGRLRVEGGSRADGAKTDEEEDDDDEAGVIGEEEEGVVVGSWILATQEAAQISPSMGRE
jgi:hypothetical protein